MENNEINKEELNVSKPKLNIPAAIVLAGVIIAAAIFLKGVQPAEKVTANGGELDLVAQVSEQDFVRGDKNAPVTLIEYADFSCHFCAQFQLTLKQLVDESKGQIKWVYRHLPIFNIEAAVASSCVGRLGGEETFWKYSDTLFANQDALKTAYYLETAKTLGIDEAKYGECIKDAALEKAIRQEFTQNKILLGFNGTPHTVLIDKNGKKFSFTGALPYDELQSVIEGLNK